MDSLKKLENTISYRFRDLSLLHRALTHRSFDRSNNERLEFLGDSILNFVIAHFLYKDYRDSNEGELSRMRANLVSRTALAEIANKIQLSEYLKIGCGEAKTGGAQKSSILADALEAIFAAVYLDGDIKSAKNVIEKLYKNNMLTNDMLMIKKDSKTMLQEILQARRLKLPTYSLTKTSGKAHEQRFYIDCSVIELGISVLGKGTSRRAAEQDAARLALNVLEE